MIVLCILATARLCRVEKGSSSAATGVGSDSITVRVIRITQWIIKPRASLVDVARDARLRLLTPTMLASARLRPDTTDAYT